MANPGERSLVPSIIRLAHDLGMTVVAEGIEHAEQQRALSALGCECGQGYWFAKPLETADVAAALARDNWF